MQGSRETCDGLQRQIRDFLRAYVGSQSKHFCHNFSRKSCRDLVLSRKVLYFFCQLHRKKLLYCPYKGSLQKKWNICYTRPDPPPLSDFGKNVMISFIFLFWFQTPCLEFFLSKECFSKMFGTILNFRSNFPNFFTSDDPKFGG